MGRRRTEIETKECVICAESRPVYRNFPSFTTCSHGPDTCITCVARQTVTQLEARPDWNACTCPQCDVPVIPEELQGTLPRTIAKEVKDLVARKDQQTDEAWRWCLNTACGYGQLQNPNKRNGNIVSCKKCGFKMCFKHQVPWHTGYDCDRYELSHPAAAVIRTDEETIGKMTKACPGPAGGTGCGWRIEKNGGCSHMYCNRCGTSWNWSSVPFDGDDRPSAAEYKGGPETYLGQVQANMGMQMPAGYQFARPVYRQAYRGNPAELLQMNGPFFNEPMNHGPPANGAIINGALNMPVVQGPARRGAVSGRGAGS